MHKHAHVCVLKCENALDWVIRRQLKFVFHHFLHCGPRVYWQMLSACLIHGTDPPVPA